MKSHVLNMQILFIYTCSISRLVLSCIFRTNITYIQEHILLVYVDANLIHTVMCPEFCICSETQKHLRYLDRLHSTSAYQWLRRSTDSTSATVSLVAFPSSPPSSGQSRICTADGPVPAEEKPSGCHFTACQTCQPDTRAWRKSH